MSKNARVIQLISNKTKVLTITLNSELVELFKKACAKNHIKPTNALEIFIIDYLEKNELL